MGALEAVVISLNFIYSTVGHRWTIYQQENNIIKLILKKLFWLLQREYIGSKQVKTQEILKVLWYYQKIKGSKVGLLQ